MARAHDRENAIGFGMRLQVICRENEKDAWEAAEILVRNSTERQKQEMKTLYNNSAANQRVQQLAREHGDLLLPHLWTGITRVRPGAGIAVVGNPSQCATPCSNSSTPAAIRSAGPAICTTRRPSASVG
jgi:alkanesulfonate monooxygenase